MNEQQLGLKESAPMTHEEYLAQFDGKVVGSEKQRAEKALDLALDIRKFEIELYWKRATYFWAFIGASLAGYALVHKATESNPSDWLSLLFSSLGLMFSTSWYLVNRGSKFWQNNWERHVDLLENQVMGPLYKTIATGTGSRNLLTSSAQYSVSKINQILSLFISVLWFFLFVKSWLPLDRNLPFDFVKIAIVTLTVAGVGCLVYFGKSDNKTTVTKLEPREVKLEP